MATGERDIIFMPDMTPENVGNKAFRLQWLHGEGLAVPRFFCVSADCMARHFQSYLLEIEGIMEAYRKRNSGEQEASRKIQRIIGEIQLDVRLTTALQAALGDGFSHINSFSVRSSGLWEDSSGASFAGQFRSFLRVGPAELARNIIRCWQSAFSPGVLSYCKGKQLDVSKISMGVICQQMLEADYAGVLFSANPQGLLNEMVVVCGNSTGDGVVEDRVPTTTYYYNRTDRVYYYESQKGSPLLPEDCLLPLIQIGERLEEKFGCLMDLEYAVKDDALWFLQMRPITGLDGGRATILDSSNIVESYPGLSLPLTGSFVKEVYYQVFRGVALRCLPGRALAERFDDVLREMVSVTNGRVYYKISNWYTILKFLPMQKKIIPIWQTMLGVSQKGYDHEKNDVTAWQRLLTYGKIAASAWGIPAKMKRLNGDFEAVQAEFTRQHSPDADNEALIAMYRNIASVLLKNWDITLLNDMYAFVFTGLLEGRLKKLGMAQPQEIANAHIAGVMNIESMKPIRALVGLAKTLADVPDLLARLMAITDDAQAREYLETGEKFAQALRGYIAVFGDRSLAELKLESPTYRSAPLLLVKLLIGYASAPEQLALMVSALEEGKAPDAGLSLFPGGLWSRSLLGFYSKKAMLGIANREQSRLNRSRIFGMVRSIFLSIGANFAAAGLIAVQRDIFYMELEEIFAYIEQGKLPECGFQKQIAQRKAEYVVYEQLPAYSRLVFAGREFQKRPQNVNAVQSDVQMGTASGTPCSNGVAIGEILVIHDPLEAGNVEGKILVTKMTDPGWVFLLAMAKGIIAEKGSILSHTAIIARELKIPSVVGVKNATALFRDGDTVRMDGGTGEIEVITRG